MPEAIVYSFNAPFLFIVVARSAGRQFSKWEGQQVSRSARGKISRSGSQQMGMSASRQVSR
ncbi:hypothetical protein E2C01_076654 [Portunus trituberculatus]|uniref:Uncharacterized protein n=1 Tax=Portunus trituberculatus TaxID=210409 RepID=A0A5B7I990_PORTR|nr:hypothetical protein [Portunus trituberculatus]